MAGGKLMFGPNVLNGQVDETMLENYVIMPMDDCGSATHQQKAKHGSDNL
jgi:hypothetical protein